MKARPLVMYLGGFAQVGGIETFARDFLAAAAEVYPVRELIMWGRGPSQNNLLAEIVSSGTKITRTAWRWGCRWNVPDFVLLPLGLRAIRGASAVIFKRPPPRFILGRLRAAARRSGRHIPFIVITPYRPAEYWRDSADVEHFDFITVQSEAGIEDLRKLGYRGRIENIPLLPPQLEPLADYPSVHRPETVRLGFLGRMEVQKNLPYLLRIFRLLINNVRLPFRFELHLFGEGAETGNLRQTCESWNLSGITFHGTVPHPQVASAIDSCDLFLNTSLTEGQCLVALEVLSRGRPLIATPVGALPEVLDSPNLGALAPLHDPQAFAEVVVQMAGRIRSGQITAASVQEAFASKFDHSAILSRYLNLISEAEHPVPPLLQPPHRQLSANSSTLR